MTRTQNPACQPGRESVYEGAIPSKKVNTVNGDTGTQVAPKLSALLVDVGVEVLRCPTCGEQFSMHHEMVEVFTRPHDGASTGTRYEIPARDPMHDTTYHRPELTINRDMRGNPSINRGGVVIHFCCEHGCPPFELRIGQCKGMELFSIGSSV
jgi:hypothetical protein